MPEKTKGAPPEEAVEREARARTFWSGTLTFGLVNIPVALMPANRTERVSLRMVGPRGTPLSRRYVAPADGRPLESDEIVRGFEVEKDHFVVVSDEELERIAPERTRDIDLRRFVKVEEIDPIHFERAYFLTPTGGSNKAYRLLARVMEETGRAGIATFVMRAKEYLVAILAENGILRAETLRFADELRTPEEVGLPEPPEPDAALVKGMVAAMRTLEAEELDPDELEDRASGELRALAERKAAAGEGVVRVEEAPAERAGTIDLMEILKARMQAEDEAGASSSSSGPVPDDATRAELYERAKELDIPGRSRMSREELAEAIRRHG